MPVAKLVKASFARYCQKTSIISLLTKRPAVEFDDQLVKLYGWQVFKMQTDTTVSGYFKARSVVGFGIIKTEELKELFQASGFAESFFFSAESVLGTPRGFSVQCPVLDPAASPITAYPTIRPGCMPDWNKLDDDLDSFLTMAALKA